MPPPSEKKVHWGKYICVKPIPTVQDYVENGSYQSIWGPHHKKDKTDEELSLQKKRASNHCKNES